MIGLLMLIGLGFVLLACTGLVADRKPDTRRYPDRPSTTVRVIPRVYDWRHETKREWRRRERRARKAGGEGVNRE